MAKLVGRRADSQQCSTMALRGSGAPQLNSKVRHLLLPGASLGHLLRHACDPFFQLCALFHWVERIPHGAQRFLTTLSRYDGDYARLEYEAHADLDKLVDWVAADCRDMLLDILLFDFQDWLDNLAFAAKYSGRLPDACLEKLLAAVARLQHAYRVQHTCPGPPVEDLHATLDQDAEELEATDDEADWAKEAWQGFVVAPLPDQGGRALGLRECVAIQLLLDRLRAVPGLGDREHAELRQMEQSVLQKPTFATVSALRARHGALLGRLGLEGSMGLESLVESLEGGGGGLPLACTQ